MGQDGTSGPVIPPRTSVRIKENRRKSLPANTSAANLQKCSVNSVNVQPASSEVIASLITTLSAISSPAEHLFDNLPTIAGSQSTPASPHPWQTQYLSPSISSHDHGYKRGSSCRLETDLGRHSSFSGEGKYSQSTFDAATRDTDLGTFDRQSASENSNLGFEDLSYMNSREARLHNRHTKDFRYSRMTSQTDLPGVDDEARSIGKVSVEPGLRTSSTSITSASGLKGMRSYKDLKYSRSNERMREVKGRLWIGDGSPEIENSKFSVGKPRLRLSDCSILSDSSVGLSNHPSPIRIPKRSSSARHSITTTEVDTRSLDSNGISITIGNGKSVPSRESSMRHSFSASPARRRRKSQRSEQASLKGDVQSPSDSHLEFPERELAQVMDDLVEEDEVTRRIRELKDQKRLRDQEFSAARPNSRPASRSPRRSTERELLEMSHVRAAPRTPSPLDTADDNWPIAQASAPSPHIAQRVDRNNVSKTQSMALTTITAPLVRETGDSAKAQSSPPRRRNSRLLRRLSRPISPGVEEKHRRTFSGGLSQPHTPLEERQKSWDLIDESVQEFLTAPRLSQSAVEPHTGRVISFSEVGDPKGSAVFCCVGMGLTRYITAFYDELATTLKLRLITPDRPGVGASDAHTNGLDTPLGWPDDVRAICQYLGLAKFSILAHSAGAIYALATALRMPQHIRGRIHLLAPWIPPSQLSSIGSQQEAQPATALPYSQRFLRSLPATFLKAANSSWLSATSASVTSKSPRRSKCKTRDADLSDDLRGSRGRSPSPLVLSEDEKSAPPSKDKENLLLGSSDPRPALPNRTSSRLTRKELRLSYDTRLTEAIWDRATMGANPAVDLLVCLERRQPIGFRYVDIKKAIVIHHGSKDTRVPLENVKWLGKTMRKCEVRILEGEGHGLMASAGVMGNVLMEISKEWEDWIRVTRGRGVPERRVTTAI